MFNILRNSLFSPKDLLKETKRSWWFVILYIMVLAAFMSLGNTAYFLADESTVVNETTTNCTLVNNQVVCDLENDSLNNVYEMYNIRIYFLNVDQTISDIPLMDDVSIVFQGDQATFYLSGQGAVGYKVFTEENNFSTVAEGYYFLEARLLAFALIFNYISNLFLVIFFILIASLMFSRYRKYMSYSNRFKLAVFGSTPIALVMTFYNIIDMGYILFFIAIFIAYRTLNNINRHLYMKLAQKQMQEQFKNRQNQTFSNDDVVDSYDPTEVYDESEEDND